MDSYGLMVYTPIYGKCGMVYEIALQTLIHDMGTYWFTRVINEPFTKWDDFVRRGFQKKMDVLCKV
jgi:hypothetical protein